jgi:drug/metabolite transporter (DMT)-like permease
VLRGLRRLISNPFDVECTSNLYTIFEYTMPFWVPAILTAFLWGVSYTATGEVIKHISKTTYMFLSSMMFIITYSILSYKHWSVDLATLSEKPNVLGWFLLASITSVVANYLALVAIECCNASMAAALEISYPFWCMVFAWLLFGSAFSLQAIVGSIIVFLGVWLIATGK